MSELSTRSVCRCGAIKLSYSYMSYESFSLLARFAIVDSVMFQVMVMRVL